MAFPAAVIITMASDQTRKIVLIRFFFPLAEVDVVCKVPYKWHWSAASVLFQPGTWSQGSGSKLGKLQSVVSRKQSATKVCNTATNYTKSSHTHKCMYKRSCSRAGRVRVHLLPYRSSNVLALGTWSRRVERKMTLTTQTQTVTDRHKILIHNHTDRRNLMTTMMWCVWIWVLVLLLPCLASSLKKVLMWFLASSCFLWHLGHDDPVWNDSRRLVVVFSRDCLLKSRASTLSSLSSSLKSLKRGVFTLDDISCQVSVSQSVNQSVSPSVQKSASKPHTLQPRNPLRWPMRNLFASAGAGQNSTYIETASALRNPEVAWICK